jgi:hypothetical protein
MNNFNHKVKMDKVMMKVRTGNTLTRISDGMEGEVIWMDKNGLDMKFDGIRDFYLKDRLSELEF